MTVLRCDSGVIIFHVAYVVIGVASRLNISVEITNLCNILQIFTAVKAKILMAVNFSYTCSKHRLWVHVITASMISTSTHNLCF